MHDLDDLGKVPTAGWNFANRTDRGGFVQETLAADERKCSEDHPEYGRPGESFYPSGTPVGEGIFLCRQ